MTQPLMPNFLLSPTTQPSFSFSFSFSNLGGREPEPRLCPTRSKAGWALARTPWRVIRRRCPARGVALTCMALAATHGGLVLAPARLSMVPS